MLLAAAAALSILAAFAAPLRAVVLACDLALALLFAFDVLRTPRPDALDVRRRLPERAALGRELARTLRIDARGVPGAAGLALEVDEEFPPSFSVAARAEGSARDAREPAQRGTTTPAPADPSGGPDRGRIPLSGPLDLVRVYVPRLRGVHELGALRLRLTGRLGLAQRSARIDGRHATAVEPALAGLRRNLLLAASERWRDLGARTLKRRGGLVEFDSLRDHVPGDEVRLVDWKAFARRGRPIVRQFREERGQELVVAIDCGRRMAATTSQDLSRAGRSGPVARGMTKLDHALDAALQLAAVALEHGDRVGALAFDADITAWIPPARGRAQLARLRKRLFALTASVRESDLERALREVALRHRRRALVLVLSDVADPLSIPRQAAALRAGSGRHRVIFAGLDDPALRAVAEGRAAAAGPVRAAAASLLEERRAGLQRLASRTVRVLDAPPAEAAGPAIAAWLAARRSG
ncbi:MAG: DUF58 domain-containing protein [Planctomycetes bacterium]|nr:DUF58 domain-containing protein [Planctomycetota bacterium]